MHPSSSTPSDPYDRQRVVGGRLQLKNVIKNSTKKHHKLKRRQSAHSVGLAKKQKGDEEVVGGPMSVETINGKGRVVSSGNILRGFETSFLDEIEPGDVIIIDHPRTLQCEERIVLGTLSQRSLTLSDGFSSDLVSTTSYEIRKDSIKLKYEAEQKLNKQKQTSIAIGDELDTNLLIQDEVSRRLQKEISKSNTTAVVRRKTGMWGYKTVMEKSNKELSAEDRLDIRRKEGRDKYCW